MAAERGRLARVIDMATVSASGSVKIAETRLEHVLDQHAAERDAMEADMYFRRRGGVRYASLW